MLRLAILVITVALGCCQNFSNGQTTQHDPSLFHTKAVTAKKIEVVQMSPLIVLRAEINGLPTNAVFDTGTRPNIIDSQLEPILAGKIEKDGQFKFCDSQNLSLGNLQSKSNQKIGLVDLTPISNRLKVKIQGIVGSPFVAGRIVEINFEDREFAFIEKASGSFETTVDIQVDKFGSLFAGLEIGNKTKKFLIDTGFSGTILLDSPTYEYMEKLGLITTEGSVQREFYQNGFKTKLYRFGIAKKMKIFDYEFTDVPVSIANSKNTIGMQIFNRFHVTMDLQEGKLRLKRNKEFAMPFQLAGTVPKKANQ